MADIKYTVRIDWSRVIAWAVLQEREDHGIYMQALTMSLDPRDHKWEGGYLHFTEKEDGINERDVITVVPATATMQAHLVLQANGQDCYMPPLNQQRVDYFAGFFTQGATDHAEYVAWLESERQRLESEIPEQFDWYFRQLEAMRNRKEREARGETVFP